MAGFQNHHVGSIAEGIAIRNAKRAENVARHDAIRAEQIAAIEELLTTSPWEKQENHEGGAVYAVRTEADRVVGEWTDSDGYVGGTWAECENTF